jgi:hypothetical protein
VIGGGLVRDRRSLLCEDLGRSSLGLSRGGAEFWRRARDGARLENLGSLERNEGGSRVWVSRRIREDWTAGMSLGVLATDRDPRCVPYLLQCCCICLCGSGRGAHDGRGCIAAKMEGPDIIVAISMNR